MPDKYTGEQSGITITSEDSYGEKVAKNIPVTGGLVRTALDGKAAGADGTVTGPEIGTLAADSATFIQSCMDAATGIATDPIGWLIGQGLNFLITVIQPLQDAIHFVSGDGPALATASGNFSAIGEGLVKFAEKYVADAEQNLAQWLGPAKDAAMDKTQAYARGVQATAAEAGNIAQLLQISSMIMMVIEDFIKAIITELITWLILIWIPALAAAIPTFGASTAAAGTATTVRAAQTGVKVSGQVSKLRKLLTKIQELLAKLKDFMGRAGQAMKKATAGDKLGAEMFTQLGNNAKKEGLPVTNSMKFYGKDGAFGKRALSGFQLDDEGKIIGGTGSLSTGFGKSMGDAVKSTAKAQVGLGAGNTPAPGKPVTHANNAAKAARAGGIGEEESEEQTSDDLDF